MDIVLRLSEEWRSSTPACVTSRWIPPSGAPETETLVQTEGSRNDLQTLSVRSAQEALRYPESLIESIPAPRATSYKWHRASHPGYAHLHRQAAYAKRPGGGSDGALRAFTQPDARACALQTPGARPVDMPALPAALPAEQEVAGSERALRAQEYLIPRPALRGLRPGWRPAQAGFPTASGVR